MATMQKKLTLADMQFAAESKGGLFLSLGYLGNQINHRWRCSAGHEWEAAPSSIRRGTWCSQCHRASTKLTLSDMREVARKKGGECLSTEYANSRTKILWRCGSGHEWLAQPSQVKIGHWCSVCAIDQKKLSIDDLRKLAAVKGGSCLSTTYRKNSNLLAWQCHSGHEWAATGTSVKSGQWCPHCLKYSIDEMKSLAMSRGGECLSDAYARIRDKLVWRCGHGHRWETSGSSIVRGGWCPACAGKKKLDLPSLQNLAATKGGRCLSNEYVDSKFPMLWQCADGHQWSAPASTIRRGSWCGPCGRKKPAAKLDGQPPPTQNASNIKLSLEGMRQLAKSRGGQCLSTRYERLQGELTWTCSRGHKWTANANNVKRGAWCPHCAGNKKATISDMTELAAKKGGKCLSDQYFGDHIKILWACALGHEWTAKPNSVKFGSWCPTCAGRSKANFDQLRRLAESKGGLCLSEEYSAIHAKLRWRCAKGHEWVAKANSVRNCGNWCAICARDPHRLTILEMQEIASARGGQCLSTECSGGKSKLLWRCAQKHEWRSTAHSVKHKRSWCPACARHERTTRMEEIHEIARSRGGQCLSKEYLNSVVNLRWKCSAGHEWSARLPSITRGSWCGMCAVENHRLTLSDMKDLAISKGGACLSDLYAGAASKLRWRCAEHHEWNARAGSVKRGQWCPDCLHKGEAFARKFLNDSELVNFDKSRPKWLRRGPSSILELDGYSARIGVAFEYQGHQHFRLSHWHATEDSLLKQQQRDEFKRLACAKHGVLLLEIPEVAKPSPERIAAAISALCQEKCYPLMANPEFKAMIDSMGGAR